MPGCKHHTTYAKLSLFQIISPYWPLVSIAFWTILFSNSEKSKTITKLQNRIIINFVNVDFWKSREFSCTIFLQTDLFVYLVSHWVCQPHPPRLFCWAKFTRVFKTEDFKIMTTIWRTFFLPFFSSFLGHQNVLIEMPNMKVLVTQAAVMFSNTMILHMMIHIQIILGLEETRRKMCMGSQGYLLQHYPLHLVQIIKFVEVLVVELVPLAQLLPVVQQIQDAMQKKETG